MKLLPIFGLGFAISAITSSQAPTAWAAVDSNSPFTEIAVARSLTGDLTLSAKTKFPEGTYGAVHLFPPGHTRDKYVFATDLYHVGKDGAFTATLHRPPAAPDHDKPVPKGDYDVVIELPLVEGPQPVGLWRVVGKKGEKVPKKFRSEMFADQPGVGTTISQVVRIHAP